MEVNYGPLLFNGSYANSNTPLWASAFGPSAGAANLAVSTLTVNSVPAGNILLTMNTTDLGQIGAPLIFQRSPGDVNAPSASLSIVPSYDPPAPYPQGS